MSALNRSTIFPGLSALLIPAAIGMVFRYRETGEKIHEELWYAHEELKPTRREGILAAVSEKPPPPDLEVALRRLAKLAGSDASRDAIVAALRTLVPEFEAPPAETLREHGQPTHGRAGGRGQATGVL